LRPGQPALLAVLTLIVSLSVQAQSSEALPPLPDSRADPAAGAGEMAPMRTGDKAIQATPPPATKSSPAKSTPAGPPAPSTSSTASSATVAR